MADIDARARGLCLFSIRTGRQRRHARYPSDTYGRRLDAMYVREAVAYLRALGPGAVEPIETGGGVLVVPETSWRMS